MESELFCREKAEMRYLKCRSSMDRQSTMCRTTVIVSIQLRVLNINVMSFFDEDILSLRGLTGFDNSLVFEENGSTAARAVCIARDGKQIIGIAGASETPADSFWEIGIDVVGKYRGKGLGTYLVSRLTDELMERDIVPFYSASVTNIGSQRTAHRSGYIPVWVDTFGTILDGSSVYDDIVGKISF